MEKSKDHILKDVSLAGALNSLIYAFDIRDAEIVPYVDPVTGFTNFKVTGNYDRLMRLVADNTPVGILDILSEIKKSKDIIYSLKGARRRERA
jgi:hypothetical protein